jgi:succinoglycan biosynthesis transport protein ExoP
MRGWRFRPKAGYDVVMKNPGDVASIPPTGIPNSSNTATVAIAPNQYFGIQAPVEGEAEGFSFQKFLRIIQRRKKTFLLSFILVSAGSTAWLAYQRVVNPVYQGQFSMLISDPVNPTIGGSGSRNNTSDPVLNISDVALNRSGVDLPTLTRVLESPVVLEPVYKKLISQWGEDRLPRIRVRASGGGNSKDENTAGVLDVQVVGNNPSIIVSALESTQKTYLAWALQQRRERLEQAVEFLGEQAPELQAKAGELQGQVEEFRLRNRLVEPDDDAATTRAQVEGLRNQLVQQQAEISRLNKLKGDVASGRLVTSGFTSQATDTGSQTSVALTVPDQAQLAELERLDTQLADARSRFVKGNPILIQLEKARSSLIPKIQATQLEAINAALEQFTNQTRSLQNQIENLERRFQVQPGLMREFGNMQQRLKLAEGNLESYVRAREQFRLEIAQNTPPWRIINPPSVESAPIEPRIPQGLIRSLLFGLLAGCGAAFLRERLDHVFHSPVEVEEELKESILGHIPYIGIFEGVRSDKRFVLEALDSEDARISRYEKFQYQEAFRNLATSLRFLNSDKPIRSIALSSSIPSEGKSLVSVLLAKTLNELGQRVLLIDSDMRKPQIHHRMGVDNILGLSNLLTDEELEWKSVISEVTNHKGWDLLTAGREPPDPPRLLSSKRMAQLMEDIGRNGDYDLVIIDTPPALGLSDAALVAEHVDGLLMVVSLRRVPRDMPALAIRRIREAGAPVLGIITNSRQLRREGQNSVSYSMQDYPYGAYGHKIKHNTIYANDPSMAYKYYNDLEFGNDDPKSRRLSRYVPTPRNIKGYMRRLANKVNSWLNE